MGDIVQLWNPRSKHRLRRNWVSFGETITSVGENLGQSGVLLVLSVGPDELCARLRTMGREFEETITPGHDITVWIKELELVIGVKAIENARMLVEFGVPPGSKVSVTLGDNLDVFSNVNPSPGPETA